MKHLYTPVAAALAALVLLASCGGKRENNTNEQPVADTSAAGKKDTVTFTIEPVQQDFYCAQTASLGYCKTGTPNWDQDSLTDVQQLALHKNVVVRKGNDLEIVTKKGKQVFKSKIDRSGMSEDVEVYYLHAVYKSLVVMKVYYYESYDFVVLDTETGQNFHTWGTPVPDPSGRMVIAGNSDLIATYTPNGLQLYRKGENNHWDLVMEKGLDDWGPEDLYWLSEKEVLGKKMSVTQSDSGEVMKTDYVKIILEEQKID